MWAYARELPDWKWKKGVLEPLGPWGEWGRRAPEHAQVGGGGPRGMHHHRVHLHRFGPPPPVDHGAELRGWSWRLLLAFTQLAA